MCSSCFNSKVEKKFFKCKTFNNNDNSLILNNELNQIDLQFKNHALDCEGEIDYQSNRVHTNNCRFKDNIVKNVIQFLTQN